MNGNRPPKFVSSPSSSDVWCAPCERNVGVRTGPVFLNSWTDTVQEKTHLRREAACRCSNGSVWRTTTKRRWTAWERSSGRLTELDRQEARYLACFAYILHRVARADHDISDEESALIERLLAARGGLSTERASLVVRIAREEHLRHGGTEDFIVTREFCGGCQPGAEAGAARLSVRGVGDRSVDPHGRRQRDSPHRLRAQARPFGLHCRARRPR